MIKKLLAGALFLWGIQASAIIYEYGDFDHKAKTCTLTGWGGQQPTSGKIVLKETYEENGTVYKVTAIAPHALDDLTEVTEITIPANVKVIGEATNEEVSATANFFNCPKLKMFKVAAGSKSFSATQAGLLVTGGGQRLVRVPQAVEFTGGRYQMPATIGGIYPDAFAGNASISTIALSPSIDIFYSNCGFNEMERLGAFEINGESPYMSVSQGVLYNKDKTELISFPPRKSVNSFSIPASVKIVAQMAFANTNNLYEVDLGSITRMGRKAFYSSGLTKIELPSTLKLIGDAAFCSCYRLQSVFFTGSIDVPENFARGCKQLTRVTMLGSDNNVGTAAFKDCEKLESFPFGVSCSLEGDSIFSGCGFKDVVYSAGTVGHEAFPMGEAMLAGNKNLKLFDMSKLIIPDGAAGCDIACSFVADCPQLTTVRLPRLSLFVGTGNRSRPNFGRNSAVEVLEMGAFETTGDDLFEYTEGEHMPALYMKTSNAPYASWPIRYMFFVWADAYLRPVIYCESYSMLLEGDVYWDQFVYPGARYFIPGNTYRNYRRAAEEGCNVQEMYDFDMVEENDQLRITLKPRLGNLTFTGVEIDNVWVGIPDGDGNLVVSKSLAGINNNITVEYNVGDVAMKTIYPRASFSSVEDVAESVPENGGITLDGKTVIFADGTVDYSVSDLSGKILLEGNGNRADLGMLSDGVYVICAHTSSSPVPVVSKILLK